MAEIFDILRFEIDKRTDITMTEVYAEIGNVSMIDTELGTYEYGMSMSSTYDLANKSEFMRFSVDEGVTWHEFSSEPADSTDIRPVSYNFFLEGVSGDLNLQIQARKEADTGIMVVHFSDAYIRRVK